MIHKVRLYAEQVPDKGKADERERERAGKSSKQVGDMLKLCDVVVADTIVCQYPVETHSDTSILDRQAGPIEGDCSINKLAIEARRGHEGATRQCAIHNTHTHTHTRTHYVRAGRRRESRVRAKREVLSKSKRACQTRVPSGWCERER